MPTVTSDIQPYYLLFPPLNTNSNWKTILISIKQLSRNELKNSADASITNSCIDNSYGALCTIRSLKTSLLANMSGIRDISKLLEKNADIEDLKEQKQFILAINFGSNRKD
ncbi:hypothetical protein BmR1_04g07437 [Babesia microti strain RI]|uniref:Uncharacterized protein n=1 Tax=Babesia microti (strain RI) TaxID=1133968 RepID=I7I9V1_BABMR|nr:hypothetical protein BmR1_04g07437 [Babesia microti strain RI]CCF75679.1 hypothetical protein BmR1_04g07437 [Babesia microti strain RI]|eukprot:XP_012650087.1 hypothetical protein BmR1_04g07437 [Babesia microti strain RI]